MVRQPVIRNSEAALNQSALRDLPLACTAGRPGEGPIGNLPRQDDEENGSRADKGVASSWQAAACNIDDLSQTDAELALSTSEFLPYGMLRSSSIALPIHARLPP